MTAELIFEKFYQQKGTPNLAVAEREFELGTRTLQHTATHTATHCNTMKHAATPHYTIPHHRDIRDRVGASLVAHSCYVCGIVSHTHV